MREGRREGERDGGLFILILSIDLSIFVVAKMKVILKTR